MSKYLSLSYNFWTLTRNAIEEMDKQDNRTLIVSKKLDGETEMQAWEKYELQTKWNDQNIGVPILFNFYHGLELFMKGLLELKELSLGKTTHDLKYIFEKIKQNKILYSEELISLLKKHICKPHEYNNFFRDNNIDVTKFYECFRYPENNVKTIDYYYGNIRGKQKETIILYKEIKKATIDFYNAVVNWNCKLDDCSEYLKKY